MRLSQVHVTIAVYFELRVDVCHLVPSQKQLTIRVHAHGASTEIPGLRAVSIW